MSGSAWASCASCRSVGSPSVAPSLSPPSEGLTFRLKPLDRPEGKRFRIEGDLRFGPLVFGADCNVGANDASSCSYRGRPQVDPAHERSAASTPALVARAAPRLTRPF